MLKRFTTLFIVFLTLTLSLSWFYLSIPQSFLSLDNRLRDFLFILRGSIPTTEQVVIVDIDESSIQQYGQWPWSRHIVADLLTQLNENGAGIIGMDIVFAEAEKSDPSCIKQEKENVSNCPNINDDILASAIKKSPVIGGYFFSFDFNTSRAPAIPAIFIEKGVMQAPYTLEPSGIRLNIDCLQDAFYSSGFFNTIPDFGGITRHIPLVMRYHEMLYPSLALEMIRIYTNTHKVTMINSPVGTQEIRLNSLSIPTDIYARLGVNYRGAGHHFHYVSAVDVLEKRVDPKEIEGKFVLIGTSALGLGDLKATPFDNLMPGVEVHANVLDTILSQDFITAPSHAVILNLAMILITVMLSAGLFYFLSGWLLVPALLMVLYGMYLFFSYILFVQGTILNILFPLMALFSTLIITLLFRYLFISKQKQHIQQAFSQKVSPAVMQDILSNETHKLLTPKRKVVTIFFSDIRSFTTISEAINDPSRLIKLLNEYMTPMVEIVIGEHGTIDKFIGDAIMAYWNAPADLKYHADSAVQAALKQTEALKELNIKLQERYGVSINIGIGIHTGEVTIGEMGALGRSDYTIIGDNVNLTSRIESLCKSYGVSLIISETTKNTLTDSYLIRELDLIRVKGKTEPVTIFEVLPMALLNEEKEHELELYYEALYLYRAAKFKEAEEHFDRLLQLYPHTLYVKYQKRCIYLMREGINDFDGIFTMSTKKSQLI